MNKTVKISIIVMSMVLMALACLYATGVQETETTAPVKPVTLTVTCWDRGGDPSGEKGYDDNFLLDWINKEFGQPNGIEVELYPIPGAQSSEKYNLLMASNEAPDIINTYDRNLFYSFAGQGGLKEVSSLIDQYGPNLKAHQGDDLMVYGSYKGNQYAVHARLALTAKYIEWIRKDWLDALGLPMPTNVEELYEALKLFKEKDPGNIGAGNFVPFHLDAVSLSKENLQMNNLNLCMAFTDQTDEEFNTLPFIMMPGFKEGARWLNRFYNDGLIDPDFALANTVDNLYEGIANGSIGCFATGWWIPFSNKMINTLGENVPGAELVPINVFQDKNGRYPHLMSPPIGMTIMLPASSKRAVEAIKYLDWMAVPDNGFTLMYGFEGVHYKRLADGLVETIQTEKREELGWANGLDLALLYNGWYFEGDFDKIIAQQMKHSPGFEEVRGKALQVAYTDPMDPPFLDRPIESEGKYQQTLNKLFQETVIKSILAPPTEFDNVYDALAAEYMANGGREILNEKIQAYRAMHSK